MAASLNESQDPHMVTFGCRLNTFESEMIRTHAKEAGLGNAIIINTCAVTQEAERQAQQTIRKLKRQHPDTPIIVTGCAAQMHPQVYASMPQVSYVLGNREKTQRHIYDHIKQTQGLSDQDHPSPKTFVSSIDDLKETASHLVSGFEGRARAFVEIQNGCDHNCTFCIITQVRGPNRSVPIAQIVDQVKHLTRQGYSEIVFTGVDITGYGQDLPGTPSLGQMVRRVLRLVPELKRLRLSSLDPVEIDSDLIELWGAEPRLMPHVHLSLQAGHDLILKRMKRRHLRQDVIQICNTLRHARPDLVFGADVIAGFPTETEGMFQDTYTLLQECGVVYFHVFPFSPREGTPAARMPQVAPTVIKDRARRLRELGAAQLATYYQSCIGQTCQVLVESPQQGRTDHYALVRFHTSVEATPGSLLSVRITEAGPEYCYAQPVS